MGPVGSRDPDDGVPIWRAGADATDYIAGMQTAILDNPVWHALTGPQSSFAVAAPHAARFVPEAAPFFAIDAATPDAYGDLGSLLHGASEARLFRPGHEPAPAGWRRTFEKPILQMVLPPGIALCEDETEITDLGAADVADMLALAARAKPGPFGPRTVELGKFMGVRIGGRLVAMAGERFRLHGHSEISAVAVDPDMRGRGYGRVLTQILAAQTRAAGKTPLLHVFPDNIPALRLYESIGFATRAELTIVWLAPA